MLVGLDVGGAFTDAVLLDGAVGRAHEAPSPELRMKAVKARTRPNAVLPGIIEALTELLRGENASKVRRVCVSSTLGLNALLTGQADTAGVLAVPGPGMDIAAIWAAAQGEDPYFHVLSGAEDHRGNIAAGIDRDEARAALEKLRVENVNACAVVCKFSPKNPEMEHELRELAYEVLGKSAAVVCGSEVSGALNFPRRLHTAYCNAALARTGKDFTEALHTAAAGLGLACPFVVLKADAGVFSLEEAITDPASTMGSGPAAGLMGVWALTTGAHGLHADDLLMVDMGGTTTDLALLAKGHPLLAGQGLTVAGRPTLIRSLWTRSIALGGDSSLRCGPGGLRIGPDRLGSALALAPQEAGARPPTLADALNVLGQTRLGEVAVSVTALEQLAAAAEAAGLPIAGFAPAASAGEKARALAAAFVDTALERIQTEAQRLYEEVASRPVYTIRELLLEDAPKPGKAVLIGGPAEALAASAAKKWNMEVLVPAQSACANAVGAALARPTRTADLYADTVRGRMSISSLGVEEVIDRTYALEDAKDDILKALRRASTAAQEPRSGQDASPQIVSAESFQMLDGAGRRGRIVKVRAQVAAGLIQNSESVPAGDFSPGGTSTGKEGRA